MATKVQCRKCPASVYSRNATWQTSFGVTSVFQDQANAEESNGRAADYVRQKFSLCAPKPASDHSR
jgi:hypothetical protein